VPLYIELTESKAPVSREDVQFELFCNKQHVKKVMRDARINRLHEYHKKHPYATQHELLVFCVETKYMVERYWDEHGRYLAAEARRAALKDIKKFPQVHKRTTPQIKALMSGVRRSRYERLRKIRKVHLANPEYKKEDLKMVCFETQYFIDLYWKYFVK